MRPAPSVKEIAMELQGTKIKPVGRLARLTTVAVLMTLVLLALPTSPASAARSISAPYGPYCGIYARRVSVGPPRVWASYRTEQVSWISRLQRWDSYNQRWYNY